MKKSFLYGTLLGLGSWIIMWGIIFGLQPLKVIINEDIRRAFRATCKINTNGGIGTGVLLDTGYIITAAHIIDSNNNGKIDKNESEITLSFYGEDVFEVKAEAVFTGKMAEYDFAIIKPLTDMRSDINIAKTLPRYGDKVFTIGMTQGEGPFITEGHHSWRDKRISSRASIFVHQGNSGGGIFSKSQELYGVVSRTMSSREIAPVKVTVPMQTKDGIVFVHAYGDARYLNHLALWCEYVDVEIIKRELRVRNLLFLVAKEEEKTQINWIYVRMTIQILGVIACGAWFKKDFLS